MFWILLLVVLAVIWAARFFRNSPSSEGAPRAQPTPTPSTRLPASEPRRVPERPVMSSAPPRPTAAPKTLAKSATTARWLPPGEAVEVSGFALSDGMLYFGKALKPIKSWALEAEPALLDPSLPIDRYHADFEGRGLPYWPSYSAIPPACRAAYLTWLAGGRSAVTASIGYVFLFFYGLERRLLFDNTQAEVPRSEIDDLRNEVARLLGNYGDNASFRRYASSLLDFSLALRRTIEVGDLTPPRQRESWELPISTRLALGALASENKALPAEWALSWVLTAPEVPLRTPAQRCAEEFRALFLLRYQETYGDGIRLQPNKTRLKFDYQPASASFGGLVTATADLPDVTRTTVTLERLRVLAERCSQDLDPFSRWVGRTGETDSPPAIALLPTPLARGRGNDATRALESWLSAQLGDHDSRALDSADLLTRWPSQEPGRPSRRELETFSRFLASRGLGIEPDVAFGGAALTRCRRAVLFRLDGGEGTTSSPAYLGAAGLLTLAAMVATADGEVTAAEERHLLEHLESALELSTSDHIRLKAHFRWLSAEPPSLSRSKKILEGVGAEERRGLGAFLISLAGADGHLGPEEMKVLGKIYPLLGLEPQSLYTDVHQLMSGQTMPAEEPVSVRPAELAQGFSIPQPRKEAPAQAIDLDLDKVRAKLAETERVSKLLGAIFVEPEETLAVPPPAPATVSDDYTLAGLDGVHSALLRHLSSAPSWERVKVERFAAALGLLPDGALEVINDAAVVTCGAPLLEGDEIIEIDPEILQEMLP